MPICPRCQARSDSLAAVCPNDGLRFIRDEALSASLNDPLLGRLLSDSFCLVAPLGRGAMGAVYEAIQTSSLRRCAIKVLRSDVAKSDHLRKRFDREARMLSILQNTSADDGLDLFDAMSQRDGAIKLSSLSGHPNIVDIFDYGQDPDGTAFLAMEFIDGHPLSHYQPFSAFSLEDILTVIDQLLCALAAAHCADIVHRDLKPDNIILSISASEPARLKILDFGLAKLLGDDTLTVLTRTGEIYGTPTYMAPEQASGDHPISPAVDIYALGVIMFELLYGAPPFSAPSIAGLMLQHVMAPVPQRPLRAGLSVSDSLLSFMRRCLDKHPRSRFRSGAVAQQAFSQTDEVAYLIENHPTFFSSGISDL
jgi:serine/threonine protein kinase